MQPRGTTGTTLRTPPSILADETLNVYAEGVIAYWGPGDWWVVPLSRRWNVGTLPRAISGSTGGFRGPAYRPERPH
jgi:hypothetical protein